jgi:type 1 glutamine amidotransferase
MKALLLKLATCSLLIAGLAEIPAAQLRALIIDGQNNHNWKDTTPLLKQYLEETGLFDVTVATTPAKGGDMSGFQPNFPNFDVVVSNYSGDEWPDETKAAFENFVRDGGGFVTVHAADNSFGKWPAYNEMIGIGGWGGRNEKSGPYLYWDEKAKKVIKDITAGKGGSHGAQHEFLVEVREPQHPIVKGLPMKWLHAQDELYDRLRGPAKDVSVLATAFADPKTRGSGRHEPTLMTISYGKGRVFHTTLGHARDAKAPAFHCVGFITTLQRGTEWAATGKVTQAVPTDFPTAEKSSLRN